MNRWKRDAGQILLPGLGGFVALLLFFLIVTAYGQRALWQMRMETAAQAAALSASRAQAQLLNECGSHNLTANLFLIRYKSGAAMQVEQVQPFNEWLMAEDLLYKSQWLLSGFKGYVSAVGHKVARLNHADTVVDAPDSLDIELKLNDLKVILLDGIIPVSAPITFRDVYYTRLWAPDQRRAQPDHHTTWLAAHGSTGSSATASVYLDLKQNAPLHNGGFPRENESWYEDIGIQSFYPQFNARLSSTDEKGLLLEKLEHLEPWP